MYINIASDLGRSPRSFQASNFACPERLDFVKLELKMLHISSFRAVLASETVEPVEPVETVETVETVENVDEKLGRTSKIEHARFGDGTRPACSLLVQAVEL